MVHKNHGSATRKLFSGDYPDGEATGILPVRAGAGGKPITVMGTDAIHRLDQAEVDAGLAKCDVMSNCRLYPKDEAPDAYKDFDEVVRSVELAKLARGVARLKARFVIKDSSDADD